MMSTAISRGLVGEVPLSHVRFIEQDVEGWDVRVPLDEGRPLAQKRERLRKKLPNVGCYAGTVIVDQNRLAIGVVPRMPG